MIELRKYQDTAVEKLRQSFQRGNKRIVLQLPTGSGKTHIAAYIVKAYGEKHMRSLFLVDALTLVDQTSTSFDKLGIDHGIVQGDNPRRQPWQRLQIATLQTLRSRNEWPEAEVVIWDEAHVVHQSGIEQMEKWPDKLFIGLTATPFTKGMGKYWDDLVVGVTAKELMDEGYLCGYTAYGPPQKADLKGVQVQGGDYNAKQLAERVNKVEIVGDVVDNWFRHGHGQQTICFAVDRAHSKSIRNAFEDRGVSCAHIDCFTDGDERREVLEDFKHGKIQIVTQVGILSKGYDNPSASCLILARPTKSLSLHIQQIGRILRPHEDKDEATIIDHGGNIERLGFPDDTLPDQLDDGKKSVSATDKRQTEESLPKPCPKCHHLRDAGIHECPACGFKPEVQSKVINTSDTLTALKKTPQQTWYAMLLWIEIDKGYKHGWAYHQYQDKFKTSPGTTFNTLPITPSTEVSNWIRYKQIKWAKSRKK